MMVSASLAQEEESKEELADDPEQRWQRPKGPSVAAAGLPRKSGRDAERHQLQKRLSQRQQGKRAPCREAPRLTGRGAAEGGMLHQRSRRSTASLGVRLLAQACSGESSPQADEAKADEARSHGAAATAATAAGQEAVVIRALQARCGVPEAELREMLAPMLRPAARQGDGVQVFLGGACNPTTWRRRLAVPALEAAGVTFYNPQVEEWAPHLVPLEARMKAGAEVLLFVVGAETRGIATMVEAAEHIAARREVLLVIEPLTAAAPFKDQELKDLQRGRTYLRDVALRNGVRVFEATEPALRALCERFSARSGPL